MELLGHAHATVLAKDVFFVAAVRAAEHGHVLDHAQHRHRDLLEHLQALAGVQQGDVLRGGDDDGGGQRRTLADAQVDVAGARGHVDHQVVQRLAAFFGRLTPVGQAQQLVERLAGHRAAPDGGGLVFHQQPDRHHLQPVVDRRRDGLAIGAGRLALNTQHQRLAGAVDVGVEHAHARAFGRQGQGQVDGRGALAHAALARGHGDHVLDTGQQRLAARGGVREDLGGPGHVHRGDAIDRLQGGFDQGCVGGPLRAGRVAQRDLDAGLAVLHGEGLEVARAHPVLAGQGVDDAAQGVEGGGFKRRGGAHSKGHVILLRRAV